MTDCSLSRSALGRQASLGDLYDGRRDVLCSGVSIFQNEVPSSAITLHDDPFSKVHLVTSDDYSGKFGNFEVNGELQASVLAGFVPLEASGKYFANQKQFARSVRCNLIYSIKTKTEQLNLYHKDLKDVYSIHALQSEGATHIVTGITWGAHSVVSYYYEDRNNGNMKFLKGSLSKIKDKLVDTAKSAGEAVSVAISGGDEETETPAILNASGNGDRVLTDADESKSLRFDIFGDILPEQLPSNTNDVYDMMQNIPKLIAKSNGGKGKPLIYHLTPINVLQSYLNPSIKSEIILRDLELSRLARVVQLFDEMCRAQQELNEFYKDVTDFRYCVTAQDMSTIDSLRNGILVKEAKFRSQFASKLTSIRSGQVEASELDALLEEFEKSDLSRLKMSSLLTSWSPLISKLDVVRTLIKRGALYVGHGRSLDNEICKAQTSKSYILYFKQTSPEDGTVWRWNYHYFLEVLKSKRGNCAYFAVDCDIHPRLLSEALSSSVQVFKGGNVEVNDMRWEILQPKQFWQTPEGIAKISGLVVACLVILRYLTRGK